MNFSKTFHINFFVQIKRFYSFPWKLFKKCFKKIFRNRNFFLISMESLQESPPEILREIHQETPKIKKNYEFPWKDFRYESF